MIPWLFGIIYDYIYGMPHPIIEDVMVLGIINLHHGSQYVIRFEGWGYISWFGLDESICND